MKTAYHILASKLRKAARNGTRVTFDPAQVQLLMSPQIYKAIARLELEELTAPCRQDNQPLGPQERAALPAMSSAPTGFGIAQIETTGPSAGTKTEQAEMDVGLAAGRLASAAVMKVSRLKRNKTQ